MVQSWLVYLLLVMQVSLLLPGSCGGSPDAYELLHLEREAAVERRFQKSHSVKSANSKATPTPTGTNHSTFRGSVEQTARQAHPHSAKSANSTATPTPTRHKRAQSCHDPPPGVQLRVEQRWVQVLDYRVIKHQNPIDYAHEKKISMRLSHYPHFVTLLSHDDDCRLLTFERLFTIPGKNKQLNLTHAKPQLDLIFDTLTNEGLVPSTEFYRGLCCNLWVGDRQNLTMFDFHLYERWTDIAKKGKAKIPALSKAQGGNQDPLLVASSLDEYNKGILANLLTKLGGQHGRRLGS